LAPQFLVESLERSIAFHEKLGFAFGERWKSFYCIGQMDGFEPHLKAAPKDPVERQHRKQSGHLDAAPP
jgi:hypothetical protein